MIPTGLLTSCLGDASHLVLLFRIASRVAVCFSSYPCAHSTRSPSLNPLFRSPRSTDVSQQASHRLSGAFASTARIGTGSPSNPMEARRLLGAPPTIELPTVPGKPLQQANSGSEPTEPRIPSRRSWYRFDAATAKSAFLYSPSRIRVIASVRTAPTMHDANTSLPSSTNVYHSCASIRPESQALRRGKARQRPSRRSHPTHTCFHGALKCYVPLLCYPLFCFLAPAPRARRAALHRY